MNAGMNQELVLAALRVVVLVSAPFIAAACVAGLLMGMLQAVVAIREPVLGYAARLVAIVLTGWGLSPLITDSLVDLFRKAWG